jgi:Skp family chaperone for outer membrane proteins
MGLTGVTALGAEEASRLVESNHRIKVGIIDLRRAFQESKSVDEAKRDLVQERNDKLQLLKDSQAELKRLYNSIQDQKELLSDVVRHKKEEDFRSKRRELERLKSDYEQQLNRQFLGINQLFLADAQKELLAMGQDLGYTFILDVNNDFVLYGSTAVDLTDELIKRLNEHQWSQR